MAAPDDFNYDFFICHANEDKRDFVAELAAELTRRHYRVWFDELSLTVSDSLRQAIELGLASSRFGVVVLTRGAATRKMRNPTIHCECTHRGASTPRR